MLSSRALAHIILSVAAVLLTSCSPSMTTPAGGKAAGGRWRRALHDESATRTTSVGASSPAQLLRNGEPLDMSGNTLVFSPNGNDGYTTCIRDSASAAQGLFPVSPADAVPLISSPQPYVTGALLDFPDGFTFPFFGANHSRAFVNIRGDIVFDDVVRTRTSPTLEDHASAPRVSAFLAHLQWSKSSSLRWQLFGDRVVITYRDMREAKRFRAPTEEPRLSSFQVALFRNGTIAMTYLQTEAKSPRIIGLSSGEVESRQTSDLSIASLPRCIQSRRSGATPDVGCSSVVVSGDDAKDDTAAIRTQSASFSSGLTDNPATGYLYYDYDDYGDDATITGIKTPVAGQIVGGRDAPEGRYPFVISLASPALGDTATPFCGGVLISPSVVASAAHCLPSGWSASDVVVHVGRYNLRDAAAEVHEVEEVAQHFGYGQRSEQDNDIMLLRLKTQVAVSDDNNTYPILADSSFQEVAPGTPYTIVGWGLTSESGLSAEVQQVGEVGHVARDDCQAVYGAASVTDSMFCAGSNGADACQGDSGGPIIRTTSDGDDFLVGLVSWGQGCNRAGVPGVYASVPAMRPWLEYILSAWGQPLTVSTTSGVEAHDTQHEHEQEGVQPTRHPPDTRYAYLVQVPIASDQGGVRFHQDKVCTGTLIAASAVLTSSACNGARELRIGSTAATEEVIPVAGSAARLVAVGDGEGARGVTLYRLRSPYTHFQPVLIDRGEYSRDLVPGLPLAAVSWGSPSRDVPVPADAELLFAARRTNLTYISPEWSLRSGRATGMSGIPADMALISCARETPRQVPCGDSTYGSPLLAMPRDGMYWADVLLGVAIERQNCTAAVGTQQLYARVSELVPWMEATLGSWAAEGSSEDDFELRVVAPDRIIGGSEVHPVGRYPFLVNLSRLGNVLCGGTLIAPNVILSAAHCYVNGLEVTIGQHTLYHPDDPGLTLQVAEAAIHDDYSSRPVKERDVMLLRLQNDVPSDVALPVRLASRQLPQQPTPLRVMGWGRTAYQGRTSRVLQEVEVDLVPQEACRHRYGSFVISESMMCAARDGADACSGDSGGPLLVRGPSDPLGAGDVQVGIVSFGVGCADERYPGVYTDVAAVLPWIEEKLAEWGVQLPCRIE